jgi:hypothetical protein
MVRNTSNPFHFPIELSTDCPPNTIIMCHRDVITAIQLSHAADRMAAHGILPQSTADELRSDVERLIDREAQAKRIGVITNIGG